MQLVGQACPSTVASTARDVEQPGLAASRAVVAGCGRSPRLPRGRQQPSFAVLAGVPSRGHRLGGRGERVLRGLLGEVEVAEEADQEARTRPTGRRKV